MLREKCAKPPASPERRFPDTEVPFGSIVYHINYSNTGKSLTTEFNIAKKIFADSASD